jgi:hypothetical protein
VLALVIVFETVFGMLPAVGHAPKFVGRLGKELDTKIRTLVENRSALPPN